MPSFKSALSFPYFLKMITTANVIFIFSEQVKSITGKKKEKQEIRDGLKLIFSFKTSHY
jgi:hypothetical protein